MNYAKMGMGACLVLGLALLALGSPQAPQAVITIVAWSPQELHDLGMTTHPSTGLDVVGMGELVYLSASVADPDTDTVIVTGYTWSLTSLPAGSAATLDSTTTQNTTFTVDTTGQYTVQVDITTDQGPASASVVITAAKYVGVGTVAGATPNTAAGQCGVCHSGNEMTWANTGHSTMLANQIDGGADPANSHYNESCIECHTVGYYEGATNGGFWDVQQQTGWTFPDTLVPGNWDSLVVNFPEMAEKSNIQCESCHGPGSLHFGDKSKISVSLDEGVCGRCHEEDPYHRRPSQWKNSQHAKGTSFARGTSASCAPCHSGWGFIALVDPASNLDKKTGNQNVSCAVCHDPHDVSEQDKPHQVRTVANVELNNGVVVTWGGNGKLCMNCHMSRRDATEYVKEYHSHFGPHHSNQTDMLAGTNAITFGRYIPSSTHRDALDETCVSCHMFETPGSGEPGRDLIGDHTFAMYAEDGGVRVDNVAACASCHGTLTSFDDILAREDYDGDGAVESAKAEIAGMLDRVGMLLPPLGAPEVVVTSDYTALQLKTAYNWLFVEEDGSHGMHNFQYSINLLKLTESVLQYGVLTEGEIVEVMDVPNDQGKQVRVNWTRFGGDGESDNPVQSYALWRRVDDMTTAAEDVAVYDTYKLTVAQVENMSVGSRLQLAGEVWDFVGSVPAASMDEYSAIVPTLYDSTASGGAVYSVFKVSGHTQIPAVYAVSQPDSGYSIDNLVPAAPTNIAGEETETGVSLVWDEPVDADLDYFAVYRGTTSGFEPTEPLAEVTESAYLDQAVDIGTTYYYRLAAVDFSENQSDFSDEFAFLVTSVAGTGVIPETYTLEQNYPNPFNPTTTIRFAVKESGYVTLTVYNALGEEVMKLVDNEMDAGNHSLSVGAAGLTSGVYFYRLEVNGFTAVRKMILLK